MRQTDFRALLADATRRSVAYLDSLGTRSVYPPPEAIARLRDLEIPLQDEPHDPLAVVAELDELVTPATMAIAGPRFFGFVMGGSLPAALAANYLAGAWDQNTGLWSPTPGTSALEKVALRWLLDVLRLPPECAGAFVTGTTVAHITALAAARHAVLRRAGWDVEADGLFGAPPITVITSEEAHPTLFKALGVVGLGRNRVVKVRCDAQGRMDHRAVPRIQGPTILCVQVGNVNTGSCDPVAAIAPEARAAGAWVHVDGAFGLWARATRSLSQLVEGVDQADSWATDAHKWLNVPYDSGVAFVRDGEALRRSMAISAAYLPTETEYRNPSDYTPELSRRARGVEIWAALRSLGKSGVADLVERNCSQARRIAAGLAAAGFEILNDVVLNQVLVSFGDPEFTRRVIAGIQQDGTCWAGETVWQGRTAMRISIINWSTTEDDIEKSLAAIVRIAQRERTSLPQNAAAAVESSKALR